MNYFFNFECQMFFLIHNIKNNVYKYYFNMNNKSKIFITYDFQNVNNRINYMSLYFVFNNRIIKCNIFSIINLSVAIENVPVGMNITGQWGEQEINSDHEQNYKLFMYQYSIIKIVIYRYCFIIIIIVIHLYTSHYWAQASAWIVAIQEGP